MTSYNVEIKQCPNCDCEFHAMVVASCNTFGAKFYTDGFIDGRMYDEGSALLTCPGCNRYFWRENVPTKKSMLDSEYFHNAELRSLPGAGEVRGNDYEDILPQALWKTEAQEKYIRIRAWWYATEKSNMSSEPGCFPSWSKPLRRTTEEYNMSHEQEANLLRLLQLLDTNDPHESIMKAEVLRQLGQFDECLKQLDQPFADRYLKVIAAIKKLANCKKRRVGRIE